MSEQNKTQFPLPKPKKRTGYKKWIYLVWVGFVGLVGAVTLLFFGLTWGWLGEMPNVKELENPNIFVASEIYSADGKLLSKFEKEKTIPLTYKELPPYLVYALQAKEDVRFKEHSGIDLKSLARAVYFGGARGGGSTITQQLAKLLFTNKRSTNKFQRAFQKLKEWVVAVQLEKLYTKEEIVSLYFNKFDFLYNANGVEMASRIYFNKTTKQLTLSEAALFIAMLENPIRNNPMRNMDKAIQRRNVVLELMLENQYIDQSTFQQASKETIVLNYSPIKNISDGYSAYYKFYLKQEIEKYLDEHEKETGKKLNLYKDGLKIYVTLDSKMQTYAEEAIKKHLTNLQRSFDSEQKRNPNRPFYKISKKTANSLMYAAMKRTGRYKQLAANNVPEDSIMMEFNKPVKSSIFTWNGEEDVEMSPWDSIRYHKQIAQAGLMSMEPTTGDIKAWVGGINWQYYQFDHVKQGKRQVGSTFKPFVYATAIINLGMTPCSTISNAPINIAGWKPKNSGGGSGGTLSMKQALGNSVNIPAARLIQSTGVDKVIETARMLGVTSDIPHNYTIALGSSDITIYEMLGAYSTFANFGNYIKPQMIWRIEDANGRVVKEVKPEVKEVMNEVYAYTMIDLMRGVAQFGTAKSGLARLGITGEVACKTGTTNNNSDGWFMGITPKLATGVWVGWEDRATHFYGTGEGQGAKMALPIWGYYMQKVYANKDLKISQEDKFVIPASLEGGFDCTKLIGLGQSDEEGLLNMDQITNPEDDPLEFSDKPAKAPKKKEESINQNINKSEDIDFNN